MSYKSSRYHTHFHNLLLEDHAVSENWEVVYDNRSDKFDKIFLPADKDVNVKTNSDGFEVVEIVEVVKTSSEPSDAGAGSAPDATANGQGGDGTKKDDSISEEPGMPFLVPCLMTEDDRDEHAKTSQ